MAEKSKIGLLYNYNKRWIAGTYYVRNIVAALNILPNENKPHITIFYNSSENLKLIKELKYPNLNFKRIKTYNKIIHIRIVKRILLWICKNISCFYLPLHKIDKLYPAQNDFYFNRLSEKQRIFWIPDFQEHYLPHFFDKNTVINRKKYQDNLIKRNVNIAFSSRTAQNDFFKIHPHAKNTTFVLRFAVFNDLYDVNEPNEVIRKYNIPKKYFFCANQFWAHKNHITILKALEILKNKEIKCHIAFSGATYDNRNSHFFQTLQDFISEKGLKDYVSFLGFIDRKDQLQLMKQSIAIIQPSLFEGWSTVVEDAKSMGQFIILSDLEVHKEQCKENVHFFERQNCKQLADIINEYNNNAPSKKNINYKENQLQFAKDFIKILK